MSPSTRSSPRPLAAFSRVSGDEPSAGAFVTVVTGVFPRERMSLGGKAPPLYMGVFP